MSNKSTLAQFVTNPKDKKLFIPGHLFSDMRDATKICEVEISQVGLLEIVPDGIVLRELFILPQVVGETHAQINGAELSSLQQKLVADEVIYPEDNQRSLRFAWHSHVDMAAVFSPPDRSTFSKIGGNGTPFDPPWWISMVMNRSGNYQIIFDMWQPIRQVIDITDSTVLGDPRFARRSLIEEIKENVVRGKQTVMGGRKVG